VTVDRFVAERSPEWAELGALLDAARGRPERLGPARLRRLGALYRATAADLAVVRRRWPADPEVARLEDLVGRARLAVYARSSRQGSVRSFLSSGYWRRVRERPWPLAVAALLLFVPVLVAGLWGATNPALGGLATGMATSADLGLPGEVSATASAEILTNNIQVTFLAFAGGITAGVLTAVILVFNGALIGVLGGVAAAGGNGQVFAELVVPHGVLELSCIVVAGAAGLRVGLALIDPGRRRRSEALVAEARAAAELALGTAPWLVLAGIVEGFVTGAGGGLAPALAVGFGLGALYWTLVLWRGAVTTEPVP
jgi:uncharacterized membrane protein SpoIIM required for sporulation